MIVRPRRDARAMNIPESQNIFVQRGRNGALASAWACVAYSLVPYLGILFIPAGVVFAVYGIYTERNKPNVNTPKRIVVMSGIALAITAVQLFFWWLLYVIPTLGLKIPL